MFNCEIRMFSFVRMSSAAYLSLLPHAGRYAGLHYPTLRRTVWHRLRGLPRSRPQLYRSQRAMRMTLLRLAVLVATGLLSTAPSYAQRPFAVVVSWAGVRGCTGGTLSPAFTLTGVPGHSHTLMFALSDSTGREYGGGTIQYRGSGKIASGAFRHNAPCAESPTQLYEWRVEALNASGETIGTAIETRPFSVP